MSGYSQAELQLLTALADQLQQIPKVADAARQRGSTKVDEEAMQIATALLDIREASRHLFDELVPRLLEVAPESPAAEELLHSIGEEYRHILYHIMDTKMFGYIVPVD